MTMAIVLAAALVWCIVIVPFQPAPVIRVFGVLGTEASVLIYVSVAAILIHIVSPAVRVLAQTLPTPPFVMNW